MGVRNSKEFDDLMDMLERQVVPLYYQEERGFPEEWIRMSKNSMKSIIPKFNSHRMVNDYVDKLYIPSRNKRIELSCDDYRGVQKLAKWKRRIVKHWHKVSMTRVDEPIATLFNNESIHVRVVVELGKLRPQDLIVECLFGTELPSGELNQTACFPLQAEDNQEESKETFFSTTLTPPLPGLQHYVIRAYPFNRLLSHPFETGHMLWL